MRNQAVAPKVYYGGLLSRFRTSGEKKHAVYGFAILGDPRPKERLECLISDGGAPNPVLELISKATYHETKAIAEPKKLGVTVFVRFRSRHSIENGMNASGFEPIK
jgi:hypothetical protein